MHIYRHTPHKHILSPLQVSSCMWLAVPGLRPTHSQLYLHKAYKQVRARPVAPVHIAGLPDLVITHIHLATGELLALLLAATQSDHSGSSVPLPVS